MHRRSLSSRSAFVSGMKLPECLAPARAAFMHLKQVAFLPGHAFFRKIKEHELASCLDCQVLGHASLFQVHHGLHCPRKLRLRCRPWRSLSQGPLLRPLLPWHAHWRCQISDPVTLPCPPPRLRRRDAPSPALQPSIFCPELPPWQCPDRYGLGSGSQGGPAASSRQQSTARFLLTSWLSALSLHLHLSPVTNCAPLPETPTPPATAEDFAFGANRRGARRLY